MISEWLGLVLTVWLACPEAAADAFRDRRWPVRENASTMARLIGDNGRAFGWDILKGTSKEKWSAWMLHSDFWWRFTADMHDSNGDPEKKARQAKALAHRRIN